MTSALRWPLDLVVVLALTALAALAVLGGPGGWLRALIVVPLVVVLPGYALVAAIFPAAGVPSSRSFDTSQSGLTDPRSTKAGIDGVERLAFSVLASIVVVPAVALAVHLSPFPIVAEPIVLGLVLVIVPLVLVAFVRRGLCPPDERYAPALLAPITSLPYTPASHGIGGSGNGTRTFNLVLGLAVLLFATSVGYAAMNPPTGEGFTELTVVPGNVTGDTQSLYPATYDAGETRPLDLQLSNHEGESVEYDLVVQLQRVEGDDVDATAVATGEPIETIDRRSVTLEDGETRNLSVDVTPSATGDDLRIAVLCYEGQAPDDPTTGNAYQSLTLPIDVGEGAGTNALRAVGPAVA